MGWTSFLHPDLKNAAGVAEVHQKNAGRSYLLPMAYPEGSPMHPSHGAGHATVAGACVTVLKALFDPRQPIGELLGDFDDRPGTPKIEFPESIEVNPSDTLEGELNKLAANIAIVRNGAGVHYRTDYTKSMALGEAVAAAVLQEKAQTFADVDPAMVFTWPNFDGHWVCINAAGKLTRCPPPAEPVQALRAERLFAD